MKRLLLLSVLVLALAAPLRATAAMPSSESLMAMLKASGAVETLRPMMDQLMLTVQADLRAKLPNLSERAHDVMAEELRNGADRIIRELLVKQIEFYQHHLTQQEVDDLIEIYNSPAWKKNIEVGRRYIVEEYGKVLREDMPRMTQEMLASIFTRLRDEGLLTKEEEGI